MLTDGGRKIPAGLLPQAKHGGHRLWHRPGLRQPGKLHKPHAIRVAVEQPGDDLNSQATLANASRPCHRKETSRREQAASVCYFPLAPYEVRQLHRQVC